MKLYFKVLGKGKPMVILHGLYGSSDNWYTIAKHLSTHYQVFLLDLRNHGRSPHTASHTFDDMVADVADFFHGQHLSKAIVVGHSMGGKVAMLFAYRYAPMVDRLIVVDIAPREYTSLREPNDHVLQHMNIIQAYAAIDPAAYNTRSEVELAFAQYIPDERIRQFLLKNLVRDDQGRFRWQINVTALRQNLPALMAKVDIPDTACIQLPALFIKGERSTYLLPKDFEQIKRIFPQAEFTTIPGAGHWVHAEQTELFLKAVLDFLSPQHEKDFQKD
ncbi:MAG: alpha/beta fold hydrolase [Bacteroidales bacterium]